MSANSDAAQRTLPQGWKWAKLGELCDFLDSRRIPVNDAERSRRINSRDARDLYPYYGANGQVGWIDDFIFDEPLILLAEDGGLFGSTDRPIAYGVTGKCWVNNHAHVLRPHPAIVDFDYCLYSILIRPDVGGLVAGATRPKLNLEAAVTIPVLLPPLDEQRRIAARLNEQLAAVEAARKAAEEQSSAARQLQAAYLRDVFGKHGWHSTNLGSLCTIVRGSSPRPKGDPRFYGGKVPRLMVEDVSRDGMYVIPKVDFLTDEGALLSRPMKRGDVVMVVSGAPGLPGILDTDACIHDGFVGFRSLHKDTIIPEFLYFSLRHYRVENDKEATGAIFRNLTTDQVGRFQIPVPPLDVQKKTVQVLLGKLASARDLSNCLESQLIEINRLAAALLREAFQGGS